MALDASFDTSQHLLALPPRPTTNGRNDGFSFWKLREDWRTCPELQSDQSEESARHFLYEEYLTAEHRQPPHRMNAYYRVKDFIPPAMRHWLNSAAIQLRGTRSFPHWPVESALIDYWRSWLRSSLDSQRVNDDWHIGFWPSGKKCGIVLTHDVESAGGMKRIERMADIEEKYGFRSSWNLPLQQYRVDWNLVDRLRVRGFEFGAHGLSHDGRLFRSESDFSELTPIIERLAHQHQLRGFRSPSTLRRAEWIARMNFDYDCSFSDTDPYEPQPGGTCSLFPFFLGDLVELPYTLPQDHTLINLVHRDPLALWTTKAHWIESVGGMILTLTHPDYCGSGYYLSQYEALLKRLSGFDAWRALPSEAACWWRERDRMTLTTDTGAPVIKGPGAERAVAHRLSTEPLAN